MTRTGRKARSVDLVLDEELFRGLGATLGSRQGPLSPWKNVDPTVTGELHGRLRALGVLDGNRMPAAVRSAVAAIAHAVGMTTVRVAGAGALVDYVAYASRDHGPVAVSTTGEPGMFRLADPAPTDQLVGFLAGLVGRSQLRGLDLVLDLSIDDALVLAALIDAQRRHALGDLAMGHHPLNRQMTVEELQAELEHPATGQFWLVDAIARVGSTHPSRATATTNDSILRLAQENLVVADLTTVRMADLCAALSENFLYITTLIKLDNVSADGTHPLKLLDCACVQGSPTDVMVIERAEGGIHMETLSADAAIDYLSAFLRHPDFAVLPRTASWKS